MREKHYKTSSLREAIEVGSANVGTSRTDKDEKESANQGLSTMFQVVGRVYAKTPKQEEDSHLREP